MLILMKSDATREDLLRVREKIETMISKEDLPNSESKFLFYFLNTKMFLEEFQK